MMLRSQNFLSGQTLCRATNGIPVSQGMEKFQVSLASWVIIAHNSNVLTLIVSERDLGLESLPNRGPGRRDQ